MSSFIYIPVSYLESIGISKVNFMQNSPESEALLKNLLSAVSRYVEIKNTLLVHNFFVLVLDNKTHISFNDDNVFSLFVSYIKTTKFANCIFVNMEKKEISIKPDTSSIFYNVLSEFIVD